MTWEGNIHWKWPPPPPKCGCLIGRVLLILCWHYTTPPLPSKLPPPEIGVQKRGLLGTNHSRIVFSWKFLWSKVGALLCCTKCKVYWVWDMFLLCQQKMKHTFDIQPIKAWDSDNSAGQHGSSQCFQSWFNLMISQGSENTAGRVDERGPSVEINGTKRNFPPEIVWNREKNMFLRLKWLEEMGWKAPQFFVFLPNI